MTPIESARESTKIFKQELNNVPLIEIRVCTEPTQQKIKSKSRIANFDKYKAWFKEFNLFNRSKFNGSMSVNVQTQGMPVKMTSLGT